MNLGELRSVQNGERSTDSLQHLRETFYEDVAVYVEELREERRAAAAETDDPFDSTTVRRLTDEIKAAEEVVEAIYERRVGKIVKRASIQAAGMPTEEDEGLTKEEAELFSDLVGRIRDNKATVLDILGGEIDVDTNRSPTTDETASSGTVEAQRATSAVGQDEPTDGTETASKQTTGAAGQESTESTDGEKVSDQGDDEPADPDRTTIRVTKDVGEIFGVDQREYVLEAEDVVALPTQNAEPLVARNAAEKLE